MKADKDRISLLIALILVAACIGFAIADPSLRPRFMELAQAWLLAHSMR